MTAWSGYEFTWTPKPWWPLAPRKADVAVFAASEQAAHVTGLFAVALTAARHPIRPL